MIKQNATLERLHPSEKADYQTILEEQGLKREVCTDGTRVKILEDITKWANDSSLTSPQVFWLTGHAGSGKTTIAYTIAKRFESGNANQHTVLGGNFLCSQRFQETQSLFRIIPTIAYQLARKCESYANALHIALHIADKFASDAVDHDLSSQINRLLIEPWRRSGATLNSEPSYLIIIDALDEIQDYGGVEFVADLIIKINGYDLRGFKFLVTSRSDPTLIGLCEFLRSKAVCRLQDVPIEEAESDIETYLKTELPELAGSSELAELQQRASGLFIYAASAVKYLTARDSITFGEQTGMLNDFLSKSYSSSDTTFLIDELYRQIMYDTFSNFSEELLARQLRILYTFLCTAERTSASLVGALVSDGDDKLECARAESVLCVLHAVLYTQDDQVFWYHPSFPDFIFTKARSNFSMGGKNLTFSCNEAAHHSLLCETCFSIMKSGLPFNMDKNISAVLRYSSRYWTHHLPSPQLINTDNICRCISEFFCNRVLIWIEAMVLLGLHNHCTPMLQFAYQWVLKVCILRS